MQGNVDQTSDCVVGVHRQRVDIEPPDVDRFFADVRSRRRFGNCQELDVEVMPRAPIARRWVPVQL